MLSSTRKMARAPRRAGVGDVGDHARDREAVKVAAAHLDDRAEAAVERAAARGFDDVDLRARAACSRRARGRARFGGRIVAVLDGAPPVAAALLPERRRRRDTRARRRSTAASAPRCARTSSRNVSVAFAAHDDVDAEIRDASRPPAPGSDRSRRRRCDRRARASG